MPILELNGVSKSYGTGVARERRLPGTLDALDHLALLRVPGRVEADVEVARSGVRELERETQTPLRVIGLHLVERA